MKKICHLTSVHTTFDTRIFLKECVSAAEAHFQVVLVATDCADEIRSGVEIKGVPRTKGGRMMRMLVTSWKVFRTALAQNADIYHFHDPEMIFYGLMLKLLGKKVVYDVHEDVPSDILMKDWIPKILRVFISETYHYIEQFSSKWFDAILPATPHIAKKFERFKNKVWNINNYPLPGELVATNDHIVKERAVCYLGVIDDHRGILEMVDAIEHTSGKLILGGTFNPPHIRTDAQKRSGWGNVLELGKCTRKDVALLFSKSMAGLVLFRPGPNHTNALPNKMFEYMSAGLPVIASNFPLWKNIIEGNNCGICIDPMNIDAIANAVEWIFNHPQEAEEMGRNGRAAVLNQYNWISEKKKLLDVYDYLSL